MRFVQYAQSLLFVLIISMTLCARGKLVKLDSRDLEIDVFDVRVEEVSRKDSVSIVQILRSDGQSGDEALFVIRAFCLIAQSREMRYFIIVEEGEDEKGVYTYTIGYLSEIVDNLNGHFGITYDKPVSDKELMDSKDLMAMFGW